MQNAYIVTGTLTDACTVTLDESLPFPATKVRLIVEPLVSVGEDAYQDIMMAIRARQEARGHRPPTPEEVDASLQAERDSWEP